MARPKSSASSFGFLTVQEICRQLFRLHFSRRFHHSTCRSRSLGIVVFRHHSWAGIRLLVSSLELFKPQEYGIIAKTIPFPSSSHFSAHFLQFIGCLPRCHAAVTVFDADGFGSSSSLQVKHSRRLICTAHSFMLSSQYLFCAILSFSSSDGLFRRCRFAGSAPDFSRCFRDDSH